VEERFVKIVRKFIENRPSRISLYQNSREDKSDIEVQIEDKTITFTLPGVISHLRFMKSVARAFEEFYGRLYVISKGYCDYEYFNERVELYVCAYTSNITHIYITYY